MLVQTYRRRYRLMMIWGRNESQVWQAFIFVFSRQQRFKRRITVHLRAQLRCVIHRSETDSTYRFQSRSPTESLRKTRHLLFIIKFTFVLLWDFFVYLCLFSLEFLYEKCWATKFNTPKKSEGVHWMLEEPEWVCVPAVRRDARVWRLDLFYSLTFFKYAYWL